MKQSRRGFIGRVGAVLVAPFASPTLAPSAPVLTSVKIAREIIMLHGFPLNVDFDRHAARHATQIFCQTPKVKREWKETTELYEQMEDFFSDGKK